MVNYSDGMNFAPAIIEAPVVKPGEFNFAVMSWNTDISTV